MFNKDGLPHRDSSAADSLGLRHRGNKRRSSGGDLELNIAGHDFLIGGDIITRLNGTRLTSIADVAHELGKLEVGGNVSMTVFRDGKYFDVNYQLPERPLLPGDLSGEGSAAPLSGRQLKTKQLPVQSGKGRC